MALMGQSLLVGVFFSKPSSDDVLLSVVPSHVPPYHLKILLGTLCCGGCWHEISDTSAFIVLSFPSRGNLSYGDVSNDGLLETK